MTVQCPRCGTQYRVPDARLSDARPVFKCTRCNHVFASGERPATRGSRAAEDRNLPLPFGGRRAAGRGSAATGEEEEPAPPPRRATPAPEAELEEEPDEAIAIAPSAEVDDPDEDDGEPTRARGAGEPAFVASDEDDEEEEGVRDAGPPERDEAPAPPRRRPRRTRSAPPPEDDEPSIEDENDDGPLLIRDSERAPVDGKRGRTRTAATSRSPMRPVLAGVGLVLAGFLGLAALLRRNPELALERLGSVPLLGRLVGDDRLVLARLQVSGLESSIEKIKGDRGALVVSGRVTNTTGQPLRLIEVEGRLLADGVERRRQVVYAANQMRKTIRDLSASEVEMLLRLEPNRRFVVRPGESATFLLVFPDPPANASEVDCRIVDARAA
ncbi:zinc-ribbon domain-containing protein [bacterium]|nr:zinc-ribbon domain-containing protein [bacterium]